MSKVNSSRLPQRVVRSFEIFNEDNIPVFSLSVRLNPPIRVLLLKSEKGFLAWDYVLHLLYTKTDPDKSRNKHILYTVWNKRGMKGGV